MGIFSFFSKKSDRQGLCGAHAFFDHLANSGAAAVRGSCGWRRALRGRDEHGQLLLVGPGLFWCRGQAGTNSRKSKLHCGFLCRYMSALTFENFFWTRPWTAFRTRPTSSVRSSSRCHRRFSFYSFPFPLSTFVPARRQAPSESSCCNRAAACRVLT